MTSTYLLYSLSHRLAALLRLCVCIRIQFLKDPALSKDDLKSDADANRSAKPRCREELFPPFESVFVVCYWLHNKGYGLPHTTVSTPEGDL
jgi:hypothetical protein